METLPLPMSCPLCYVPGMWRARKLIEEARARQVARTSYDQAYEDSLLKGELVTAAGFYESGEGATRPAKWPLKPEHWKPSSDRRKNLILAGVLLRAELERMERAKIPRSERLDPYKDVEIQLRRVIRKLEEMLPELTPSMPVVVEGWDDVAFDAKGMEQAKKEWGCTLEHATIAATLGVGLETLRPFPEKLGMQELSDFLRRLKIPHTVRTWEREQEMPEYPRHGFLRLCVEVKKNRQTEAGIRQGLVGVVLGKKEPMIFDSSGWCGASAWMMVAGHFMVPSRIRVGELWVSEIWEIAVLVSPSS